jgi:DNA mismatch endonuclease (patch repair protein)
MQAVPRKDTAAEVALRKELHARGLRFRKDCKPDSSLRCKADVVFRKAKLCVFVDGCFWHRCPLHFSPPRANSAWWAEKIESVVERDSRQGRLLLDHGWKVLRFWEHEVREDVSSCAAAIERAIQSGASSKTRRT